jgi:hypothetical protein
MMSTRFGRTPSFLSWYYLFHNISLEELRKIPWNMSQCCTWSCPVSSRELLQRILENLRFSNFVGPVLGKTDGVKSNCAGGWDNLGETKEENKEQKTKILGQTQQCELQLKTIRSSSWIQKKYLDRAGWLPAPASQLTNQMLWFIPCTWVFVALTKKRRCRAAR